jgi:hypothetical protein
MSCWPGEAPIEERETHLMGKIYIPPPDYAMNDDAGW